MRPCLSFPLKNRLDSALLTFLLPRLLSRVCGATVHHSGDEGARTNCFRVTIPNGDQPDLVLLGIVGNTVTGLRFDGQRYSIDVTVSTDDIDPDSVTVTHYYGLDKEVYRGLRAAALGLLTGWPYLWIHGRRSFNVVQQFLFNRRTLPVRSRLDLLREVLMAVKNGSSSVNAMDLMSRRHGDRWAGHPN